jgi:hypothetical protein
MSERAAIQYGSNPLSVPAMYLMTVVIISIRDAFSGVLKDNSDTNRHS